MLGECHISFFILSSLYFYLTLSILGCYSDLGVSANLHISFYPPYMVSRRGPIANYISAYSHKIIPVFLTISSTVMGMLPFFWEGEEEPFWFSFAMGVTGGLLSSVFAIVFIMPLFVKFGNRQRCKCADTR